MRSGLTNICNMGAATVTSFYNLFTYPALLGVFHKTPTSGVWGLNDNLLSLAVAERDSKV